MNEYTAIAIIFVATTAAALALFAVLTRRPDSEAVTDEPARRTFGPFTPAIAGVVPASDGARQSIQQDLWLAGYYQPAALGNFLAMRSLLTLVPVLLGLGFALLADDIRLLGLCVGAGLVCGVLGFAVPRVVLAGEAKDRGERIRRGVPMFMDTLALCLSTGNGLPESFRRSGDAIRRGFPALATDVGIVHRQAQLRSMEHALEMWRRRTPLPEVGSLVFLLAQSDRLGTDVTTGLFELSSSYRINVRQDAEAAANRTNFFLLFPTVFCLLMAAGIILVGPGFLLMYNESQKIGVEIDKAAKSKEEVEQIFKKLDTGRGNVVGEAEPIDAPRPAGPGN